MKFKLQLLSNFLPIKRWTEEAKKHADSLGLARHVPHRDTIPADLKDRQGNFLVTENGFSVAGRMLPEEVDIGTASPFLPIYIGLYALVFVASKLLTTMGFAMLASVLHLVYFAGFFTLFGGLATFGMVAVTVGAAATLSFAGGIPVVGQFASKFQMVFLALPAFFPFLYWFFSNRKRASQLAYQSDLFSTSVLSGPKTKPNKARFAQAERAEQDKTHFTQYGVSTGAFSFFGDEFGPDAGLAMGQTTNDQATNLIFFGAIGSGKTTTLRTVFKGVIDAEKADLAMVDIAKTANAGNKTLHKRGMVVLDGKAVLAQDCAKFLDVVVGVGTVKNFNFFEGLTPEVLATTLENQFAPKKQQSGNSSFFTSGARTIVFYTKVFQDAMIACNTGKKSVMEFYRIAGLLIQGVEKDGSHPLLTAIQDHPDFCKEGTLVQDAVNYLATLQLEPAETKQNIFATFRSWISPFVQSEELRSWADSETSDFDFNQVVRGLKIGFVLPASKLGVAGTAITALMKARLFTMISSRGDRWMDDGQSQVVLFIDEAQRVIDKADQDILPVARSLGLFCVYATQNIDNLNDALGQDGTGVTLESFLSIICLKSSYKTYEYMSNRIGKARIWMAQSESQNLGYSATSTERLKSAAFDPQNPHRTWMKSFGGKVVFGNLLKKGISDLKDRKNGKFHILKKSENPIPILQESHLEKLNEPFVAIAIIQRGGVVRRDIIKTIPLDSNFEPLLKPKAFPVGYEVSKDEKIIEEKLFGGSV